MRGSVFEKAMEGGHIADAFAVHFQNHVPGAQTGVACLAVADTDNADAIIDLKIFPLRCRHFAQSKAVA